MTSDQATGLMVDAPARSEPDPRIETSVGVAPAVGPQPQVSRTTAPESWRFAIAVASCFGVILAVGLGHHELWRDELQAWVIVRHSATPWALLHNLRYEGHPPLWHFVLWAPAQLTSSTAALQWVQLTIAISTVLLFTRFAPFNRWLRVLFAFGYFPLFEYGVLSRNYSLGLLIAVLVLTVAGRHPRRWVTLGGLLGLLALTSVFGAILAASLALGLVAERDPDDAWKLSDPASRAGAAIFALGTTLSLWLVRPPADGLYGRWRTDVDSEALTSVLGAPWQALVPLPRFEANWWNTNALGRSPDAQMLLGVALVVAVAMVLHRCTGAIVCWASAVLLTIWLAYTRALPMALRQEGTLYLAFIAATWLACAHREHPPRRAIRNFLAVILVVQAVIGVAAFAAASTHEFTSASAAARWIARHEPHDVVLVGDNAAILSSVAYRLDRPIVFPEDPSGELFVLWKRSLQPRYESEGRAALRLARRIARRGEDPVLLVLGSPLPEGTGARLRAQFGRGIEVDEHYWIYTP